MTIKIGGQYLAQHASDQRPSVLVALDPWMHSRKQRHGQANELPASSPNADHRRWDEEHSAPASSRASRDWENEGGAHRLAPTTDRGLRRTARFARSGYGSDDAC